MLKDELFKEFFKNKKNLKIRNQLINLYVSLVNKVVNEFTTYPPQNRKTPLSASPFKS